jgi:hypothetical protein
MDQLRAFVDEDNDEGTYNLYITNERRTIVQVFDVPNEELGNTRITLSNINIPIGNINVCEELSERFWSLVPINDPTVQWDDIVHQFRNDAEIPELVDDFNNVEELNNDIEENPRNLQHDIPNNERDLILWELVHEIRLMNDEQLVQLQNRINEELERRGEL